MIRVCVLVWLCVVAVKQKGLFKNKGSCQLANSDLRASPPAPLGKRFPLVTLTLDPVEELELQRLALRSAQKCVAGPLRLLALNEGRGASPPPVARRMTKDGE
jgi:hypothetical protein